VVTSRSTAMVERPKGAPDVTYQREERAKRRERWDALRVGMRDVKIKSVITRKWSSEPPRLAVWYRLEGGIRVDYGKERTQVFAV
jgi:hypothetical protein